MVNKFHYLKGGSETYHFAVGESLEAAGCEVAWFAMEDPKNLPCKQSRYFVSASDYNGKTSPLKKAKDGLSLIYSNEAKRKFNELLEDFKPDVIHLNLVHRQLTFSILDAPYLKTHLVPVIYTALGTFAMTVFPVIFLLVRANVVSRVQKPKACWQPKRLSFSIVMAAITR